MQSEKQSNEMHNCGIEKNEISRFILIVIIVLVLIVNKKVDLFTINFLHYLLILLLAPLHQVFTETHHLLLLRQLFLDDSAPLHQLLLGYMHLFLQSFSIDADDGFVS